MWRTTAMYMAQVIRPFKTEALPEGSWLADMPHKRSYLAIEAHGPSAVAEAALDLDDRSSTAFEYKYGKSALLKLPRFDGHLGLPPV